MQHWIVASIRSSARRAAQFAYLRMRTAFESIAEVRSDDPGARLFAEFGAGSQMSAPYDLVNAWATTIGHNTRIRSHFMLEAYAPAGVVVVRIGNNVHIGHSVRIVAFNGIVIDDLVSFGHGITVSDSVHDWKEAATDGQPIWDTPPKVGRTLRIKEGAWIGNNVVIAGGLTVGAWTVITPNSVISRDVPDRTMVGGNPARILRRQQEDGTWEPVPEEPLLQS